MIWNVIFSILSFIAAVYFPVFLLGRKDIRHRRQLLGIITYHFIFGIAYYFLTQGGGDAWFYYTSSKLLSYQDFQDSILGGEGTRFLIAFNYILANWLDLDFFANTMFYTMLGSIGMTYFFVAVLRLIPYNSRFVGVSLFPLLFFLPSLHFWSAGLGKDSLLFLCIGMFSYGIIKPSRNMPSLFVAILLAYAVRPHIALMLIVCFAFAYVSSNKVKSSEKIFFFLCGMILVLAILPSVMDYVNVDDIGGSSFVKRASTQASLLSKGAGSAVDISSYPFPLKIFTFLYRPLFFDVHNLVAVAISFENLFLLIFTLFIVRKRCIRAYVEAPLVVKGGVIFFLVGTLLFSISLGNLGIMLRMRNMFLPSILIFFLWVLSYEQQKKHEN